MTTFRQYRMAQPNLQKKIIFFSLYSAAIFLGSCYGMVDARDSTEPLPAIPEKLESKPPNYRPIPRRYEELGSKDIAQYSPTEPAIASGAARSAIAATSNKSQIALAKYLRRKNIKFYGAWWCPHCSEQKELFGKQAFEFIRYVECAERDNPRSQKAVCKEADIQSYPTWIIKGKKVEGVQSLAELANLSGYRGKRNFPSP